MYNIKSFDISVDSVTLLTMQTEKNFYRQVQKEVLVPILDKLYSKRGALADLARHFESNHLMKHAKNRLAELRSGNRLLSFFFLNILIKGGVMSIDQILRGRNLDELNPTEKEIILRLLPDPEILQLLYDAKKEGIDAKQLLKISLKRS